MNDMKPKSFPTGLILIIVGAVLLAIGVVTLKITGSERYVSYEDINQSFDGSQVEALELNIGSGIFKIETTDSNEIRIEGSNVPTDSYTFSCDNSVFSIDVKEFKWYEWYKTGSIRIGSKDNTPTITVYIPDKEYSGLNIDMGAGECTISNLTCKSADIDFGAGEGTFNRLTVLESADIDCGAGESNFIDCNLGGGSIDCGVGDLNFSGKVSGNLDVDGGVGDCTLKIDGYKGDYDITTDGGIGDIEISGSNNSDSGISEKIKIDVSCGVGDIDLIFN